MLTALKKFTFDFLPSELPISHVPAPPFCSVGGTMDTMETIEVASGLSTEVKMLVAVCVVLATMLVLTMVSS